MIIYDLKCKRGHKFEGWFRDRANYEQQRAERLIICPTCDDDELEILPSALSIVAKDTKTSAQADPREVSLNKAARQFYEFIEKNFEDVGNRFCEVALGIHHGDEQERNIKGTTTASEEKILTEEGVKFHKIPVLKLDS